MKHCKLCKQFYSSKKHFTSENHLKNMENVNKKHNCVLIHSAFKNRIQTFSIKNLKYKNVDSFLKICCKKQFKTQTLMLLQNKKTFKFNVHLICQFKKLGDDDVEEFNFKTKNFIITESTSLNKVWSQVSDKLRAEITEFEVKGSNWTLSWVDNLELRYSIYQPIRGSSYLSLPKTIKKTHAVVNFNNKDEYCFKYAILSKHVKKITSIQSFTPYYDLYNWEGINWPIEVDEIKTFEKNNADTSVNVFHIDNDGLIKSYRIAKMEKADHFDLLLLNEGKISHFAYIRNFNRLIAPQIPSGMKSMKKKIFICKRCMLQHLSEKSLKLHKCTTKTNMHRNFNSTVPLKFKMTQSLQIFEYPEQSFRKCILYGFDESEEKFDWSCVEDNTTLKQVRAFEKKNDISINIFGLDDKNKNVMILKTCKEENINHIDLLLTSDENGYYYYSYIKCLNKFLCKLISKSTKSKHICKLCFSNYKSNDNLLKHKKNCVIHPSVIAKMPDKFDNVLKFKNFHHQQRIPFVVYLDFECILQKIDTVEPNPNKSFTTPYQLHKPFAFAYYIVGPDIKKNKFVMYTAKNDEDDVVEIFFQMIKKDVLEIDEYYKKIVPLNLTKEDEDRFNSTTHCEHCACSFENAVKTRDHDHFSNGRLRYVLCQVCNLKFRKTKIVPVFTHNLSSYDGHLICKGLSYDDENINIIPSTKEKYLSFTKTINKNISMRFVDTFRFLGSSLETLVNLLPKNDLKYIQSTFSNCRIELLYRKGIFCYDYLDNLTKLNDTKLPDIKDFYSKLYNKFISEDDYNHAILVWNHFSCKSLKDYAELYLKTDVILLTEVFESFRNQCIEIYDLDAAWYFSIPGLSMDAMLKMTGVEIELLCDYDMQLFFEKSIRGGVSQCNYKYKEANNKYMGSDYNEKNPDVFLTYLDCNNLYGYSMNKKHPLKNFAWLSSKEIKKIEKNILFLSDNDEIGYFLEVDIDYPDNLHEIHNDFPFLSEKKTPPHSKVEKLLTTLEDKRRYVLHYLNLKQAIEHGLILRKIHRGIKFLQSNFLSEYVKLNTELRKKAKTKHAQNFYKLVTNSLYGRLLMQLRNRINVKLITKWKQARRLIAKPTFLDYDIYNKNLVLIKMMKTQIKFNAPIAIGASILEQSKLRMYYFHYDVILPKFGSSNVQLMYMDTDSFFYAIRTNDLYYDFYTLRKYLDTCDYPVDHFSGLYSEKNKKKIGKFKDELNGKLLTCFVGLASKLYAFKLIDGHEAKKAKGVNYGVTQNDIRFDDYVECLFTENVLYKKMNNIISKNHNIQTVTTNKLVLNFKDDKRFTNPEDKISTYAFGHYKIRNLDQSFD